MKKFLLKIITAMTVLTSTISTVVYADEEQTSNDSSTVRILFTHDLHDHIDSYRVTNTETREPEVIGGYAQLAGTIAANRNDHTVLVDAGDFSMGTFYNALFEKSAPDLSLLGMMGYDATTLGNHEFDYGVTSLTKMIESSINTPPILCSNLTFGEDEESQALKKAWEDHGGAEYKTDINENYLKQYGYTMDQSIGYTNFPLTDVYEDYSAFTGNSMADLITDAYVYASKLTTKDTSFTIGLTAKGIIRSGLVKGDITVGEVYDAVNLGKGNDGLLGYPLIRIYMKGSDLIKVAELDRSVGKDMMVDGQLFFSGMQYHYSDYRFILNHVVDAEIRTNAGFYIPVEKDKLYPVVTNLYIANMLPSVVKKTFNQLDIHTYDASGHEIKDFSDMILYNADGTELKEWQAITRYILDMGKVNGVSEMKAQYQTARVQKNKDKHFSFIRFFQNTSAFGYRIYLAIIIAITALLGIIRLITYLIRKQREKK